MSERLKPDQLSNDGKKAYQKGEFQHAAQLYEAAADAYLQTGETLSAAEARNNSSVAYLKGGDSQAALRLVEGTPEIFAGLGDIRRQATATGNYAAALEGASRNDEAMEAYEESADLFYQIGDNDMRLQSMQALSALQLQTGRRLQALASMKAGLDDIQRPNPKQRVLQKLLEIPFKIIGR